MVTRRISRFIPLLFLLCICTKVSAGDSDGKVTFIHTGDFHGHLVPRPNLRSDGQSGVPEGGLARICKKIRQIRGANEHTLLIHTGDTIQGGAEVLFTRGQAMVDILNDPCFGIDAFVPGNWEFVYGTERFRELFTGNAPLAPWNVIGANVYYSTLAQDPTTPYPDLAGQRVLPPYIIRQMDKLKVGIIGLTTDRGPQVVGKSVTKGFYFLKNGTEVDAELQAQVTQLRNVEAVNILAVASEMGLANNIRLAEKIPGIDVIFSSDMHEETTVPVVTSTGTVILEMGQDGTMMGMLDVKVKDGVVSTWDWTPITVDGQIPDDSHIAEMVLEARKTFVTGPYFTEHVNPFNGSTLTRPIDTVVGYTNVPLYRSNFSDQVMPGAIEGSSHDFLTDAFKAMTGADVGGIRGFRYGTHVAAGPITLEDLYHFMPIGPQIAVGTVSGQAIKNQIENAANGSMNPDVSKWTGGWLFNFSGLSMDIDPYGSAGNRASNILVNGTALDTSRNYTYASYWYAADPELINVLPATNITVLTDEAGNPLDATEVVARYLASLPYSTANTDLSRIHLTQPLPAPLFGNPEIQPLKGVGW